MVGSTVRQKLRGAANGTIGASMHQDLTPNISGVINGIFGITGTEAEGALKKDITKNNLAGYTGSGAQYGEVSVAATSSNAIYGLSQTVQPSSMLVLPCIKI